MSVNASYSIVDNPLELRWVRGVFSIEVMNELRIVENCLSQVGTLEEIHGESAIFEKCVLGIDEPKAARAHTSANQC